MVWVRGNQTQDFAGGRPVCDRLPQGFTVDRANETLRYDRGRYDIDSDDVRVLVAADHEDRTTQCPVFEVLEGDTTFSQEVDWGWNVTVAVGGDGSLMLQETAVPPGSAGVLAYEGDPPGDQVVHVEGTLEATTLDAWDRADLQER